MKHFPVLLNGACIGVANEIHFNVIACVGNYAVARYGYRFPNPDPSSLVMDCLRELAQEVYGDAWIDHQYLLSQVVLRDGFWIVGEIEEQEEVADQFGADDEQYDRMLEQPEYEFLEELEGVDDGI